MKELIKKGLLFVRNNPTIIYSLALIFVVVGALFANSYFILTRFQENLDKTLRTKAVLAENIIGVVAEDYFADLSQNREILQQKISKIQENDPEIVEMAIYKTNIQKKEYSPIVSSKSVFYQQQDLVENKKILENAIGFALSVDDAFAYLSNNEGNRSWSVVKAVRSADGSMEAVLLLKLSLAENDALVGKTIFQVYLFSVLAMVVVLLLVFNHVRLFSFEVKAKKLEEVDKMKDDFISMASHELRSPLTAIRGYIDLLADMIKESVHLGSEKNLQKKYLSNIEISVDRLNNLVEDLLDVSRLQQNRIPFEFKEINLTEIVHGIASEMKVLANEKGIELNEYITEVPNIKADPERVKQILVNLISNAIKYTPKGKVDVQIRTDEKKVYIVVADTGLGISAENMKNLFSKFYRVKTIETSQISGTGLGLWIAREIAQKMGGDIKVESIVGVGSHFVLELKK
ncbi:MAG: two-component sensor histidine kinase [uncultured bacterium]|nr:MAG: two-component sensor histidine kinase [uncultured bacterium]